MHMMPTDTVVEYLLSAPKIVREAQPMQWQPLNHLGTNFASDGYVWADVEQAFTFEARGYVWRLSYASPNFLILYAETCL